MQYCSQACRRRGLTEVDRRAEAAIRDQLARGAHEIALSDVVVGLDADADVLRRAARRLVAAGVVDLVQRGRVVDPSTAKGPLRVRAHRSG